MFTPRTIKTVVLTVTGRAGEAYAVVVYTDGTFGIARDGRPVEGYVWDEADAEMDECTEALLRLTRVGDGPQDFAGAAHPH